MTINRGDTLTHVDRKTQYNVIGPINIQTAEVVRDDETLICYMDIDTFHLYARKEAEIEDGRFVIKPHDQFSSAIGVGITETTFSTTLNTIRPQTLYDSAREPLSPKEHLAICTALEWAGEGTKHQFMGKLYSRREIERKLKDATKIIEMLSDYIVKGEERREDIHPEIGCTNFELSNEFEKAMTFLHDIGSKTVRK